MQQKKQIKLELQPTHSDKNSNLKPYSKVIDWIYGIEDNNGEVVTGKWEKELTEIPPGENYIALTEKKGHPNPRFIAGKRYWSSLLKLNPLLPSWTIIASPGHWEGPFHWENRRLTNNECAAIQTFPRDYKFSGSSRSVRKQIGNAVPPLLSYTIFKEVIKSL
ncbi:DNA cytosine methyltransferase [Streptococcus uberis]|nr:DNA cytosine methyltransferase [Streptococcus uberis]MCK1204467.1 DNA cytosine methyltransferase [Streptococcus uberis]